MTVEHFTCAKCGEDVGKVDVPDEPFAVSRCKNEATERAILNDNPTNPACKCGHPVIFLMAG